MLEGATAPVCDATDNPPSDDGVDDDFVRGDDRVPVRPAIETRRRVK